MNRHAKQSEQSQDGSRFFSLIYNEQHAPAIDWFTDHGWQGTAVDLPEYCRQIDRPVPGPDSEAGPMFASISSGQRQGMIRPSRT